MSNYYDKYSGNTGQKWQKMTKEGWDPRESMKLLQEGKAKSTKKNTPKRSYEPPASQKRREEPEKKKKKILNEKYWNNNNNWSNIPKTLSQEKKYIDVAPFYQPVSATNPQIIALNRCEEGTGFDERIGKRIRIKSIEIKINLIQAFANLSDLGYDFYSLPTNTKIQIILDKQCNGVYPDIHEIYKYYLLDYTNLVYLNPDNRERFKVLYNKDVDLDGGSSGPLGITASGGRQTENIHAFIPVDITTTYQGIDNDLGSLATNAIYLVVVTNGRQGNSPAANYPFQGQVMAYMSSRIRFVE